jgi:4-aminobutyrate aminotransferase-like enzyme
MGIPPAKDILIAVDDIQQGFGRTGTWSSVSHFNFTPDLITFGKSLAGGMPISSTAIKIPCSRQIFSNASKYPGTGSKSPPSPCIENI